MKIFIDTAKLDEIRETCSWGIVDGVTTNPSLIKRAVDAAKKEGRNIEMGKYIEEICKTVGRGKPVSLEVISLTRKEMMEEAAFLHDKFNKLAGNVVIKIPINTYTEEGSSSNYEGLMAINKLSEEGIPVNVTLVMTPEQALLAAKAGAQYVSPFAGRIDDYIRKKLGIDFEKGDYFNFELTETIGWQKFCEHTEKLSGKSPKSIYQNKETKRWAEFAKDNGIASGVDLVKKIIKIYKTYDIKTEVIAASIRNARQAREVAQAGADIATIPFSVIKEMLQHPKTIEGIKRFAADVVPEYKELF